MDTELRISPLNFKDSFFYIGAGKDFEPLLRYSNQCRTFMFCNLYMEKEIILDYINRYFRNHFFLDLLETRIIDFFDEQIHFELHPQYRQHLNNIRFLGNDNYEKYLDSFSPACVEKQWMIKLTVLRKDLNRVLTLYYFTSEGLVTYIALSHNGLFPPKVLCTIETKVLECDNGIMLRLFEQVGSSPEQWIKGFEGGENIDESGFLEKKHACFNTDGLFDSVGMDFTLPWDVEGSYMSHGFDLNLPSARHCRVFIKNSDCREIESRPFKNFGRHCILYGDFYGIVEKDAGSKKLIIVTKPLHYERPRNLDKTEVLFWEDIILSSGSNRLFKCSMRQSLTKLDKILRGYDKRNRRLDKVYFVPYGLEDQGSILAEFLGSFDGIQLNAVVSHPLDLIDLRATEGSA